MPSTRKTKPCVACRTRRTTTPRKRKNCVACQTTCTNCTSPLLTTTDPNRTAQWLSDLQRQAIPRHCARWRTLEAKAFHKASSTAPTGATVRVVYKVRKRGSSADEKASVPARVVYWAAESGPLSDGHNLRGAERAYGEYTNMGVAVRTETSTHYVLTMDLVAPCPYIARARGAQHAQQWCRHLHYVPLVKRRARRNTSGSASSTTPQWHVPTSTQNKLFTLPVFPCHDREAYRDKYSCTKLSRKPSRTTPSPPSLYVTRAEYRKATHPTTGRAVGICAIDDPRYPPLQAHDRTLSWTLSESAIQQRLKQWGYHPHTPLVVYCANPGCTAAQVLIESLAHLGWCNVWYFQEGMGI